MSRVSRGSLCNKTACPPMTMYGIGVAEGSGEPGQEGFKHGRGG